MWAVYLPFIPRPSLYNENECGLMVHFHTRSSPLTSPLYLLRIPASCYLMLCLAAHHLRNAVT